MKEAEGLHQPGNGKVHRTQAENGEHVRRIDNEGVESHGEDCRDRVDGKEQIGGFDYRQNDQQRRCIKARISFPSADEEAVSLKVIRDRQKAAQGSDRWVLRRIDLMLAGKSKTNPAIDQERTEQIENPVEALDEADASQDEDTAHEERTEDSPKQNAALVLLRNGKVPEYHEKDEEIVHTEGEFEYIACDEFKRDLSPLPEKDHACKSHGEGDPHGAPGEGFSRAHHAAAALKDEEIQHQHAQREQIEENPKIEQRASLWGL